MKLLKYILLSISQGFTEPLPISSSGHIKIISYILKNNIINDLNFEIIVNFGSFLAIVFLYKSEIFNIIKESYLYIKTKEKKYKTNYKYLKLIIVGTIPVCVVGLFIKDFLESIINIKLIGLSLLITSLFLYLIKDNDGYKDKNNITYLDAFIIGLYQVVALFPGISRSGACLVGGLNQNLNKKEAVNFSFMLYLPVSLASMILGIKDLSNSNSIMISYYIISIIVSMIVTYFSSKLFINIVKNKKLIIFSIYCLIVGLIVFFI